MFKPAFSTVACPHWTLAALAEKVESFGFLGMEMRTFGNGSRDFACDPALTAPAKVRGLFRPAGLELCSLATDVRFDQAVTPPVIGRVISDTERSVRQAKSAIDLAVELECLFVRVFGFELPEGERRKNGVARIVERLTKAADHCRNAGVTLVLENGGSFSKAADLAEILDAVDSPLLRAAYAPAVAALAGESPAAGINVLGERLAMVKLKDMRGTTPVALGEGDLRCRETCEALHNAGFAGWVVYEFDHAWLGGGHADVSDVLARSARTLFSWRGGEAPLSRRPPTKRIVSHGNAG